MPCEIDIHEAAEVTPTDPQDTDLVLMILQDKTVVFRTWGQLKAALVPEDFEQVVVDGNEDGVINTGESEITLEQFKGFRVRVIRGGVQQPKDPSLGYYYTYDIATGHFVFVPAAQKEELFQITAY